MPENFRRSPAHSREDLSRAPTPTSQTLDLTSLTEQEERIIQAVIKKDEEERNKLDAKISEVRREIQELRKAGALAAGDDQKAICARCKFKFPPFILPWGDHGQRCVTCKFRVCNKCCSLQSNGTWLCILCLKYRQEKLLTGEWMSKDQTIPLQGSDLLRASLRDRRILREKRRHPGAPSQSTPNLQVTGAEGSGSPRLYRNIGGSHGGSDADSPNARRSGRGHSAAKDPSLAAASVTPPLQRVLGASPLVDTDCSDDATSSLSVDIGDASLQTKHTRAVLTNSAAGDSSTNTDNSSAPGHSLPSVDPQAPDLSSSLTQTSDQSQSSGDKSSNTNLYDSNSVSDQTLYYDDVKLTNPNLSRLSSPDSRSSSSLCSEYGINPKYKSLKPATGRSQLELFRKKGERYFLRRKKLLMERANANRMDSKPSVAQDDMSIRKLSRQVSVQADNEWIPHWHETIRRKSVVDVVSKPAKTKSPVPSRIPSVVPPKEGEIFALVKPKPKRTEVLKDPNYLAPNHSRDNSSSSSESISLYVEAVKASMCESEHAGTKTQPSLSQYTLSAEMGNDTDTPTLDTNAPKVTTSTPKANETPTDLPQVNEMAPDRDSPKQTQRKSQISTERDKPKDPAQLGIGKSSQSGLGRTQSGLARGHSLSMPRQKHGRSGVGASLPRNWGRREGWREKRKLPTPGKIPESRDEKTMGSGEKVKLLPSQRRDSYSRALENQKVTVILPKGNANSNSRVDTWGDGVSHPAHGSPAVEPLDLEKERDSDSSSIASYSSYNASYGTNNEGSSEDMRSLSSHSLHEEHTNQRPNSTSTPKSRYAALPDKFRFRKSSKDKSDSFDSSSKEDEKEDVAKKQKGDGKKQGPSVSSDATADQQQARRDSFEEVYNSNVNRLVKMISGGQTPVLDGNKVFSSKNKRGLPQAPKTGKTNQLLLQQSLSLSEEMSENAKYQSFDDDDDGGGDFERQKSEKGGKGVAVVEEQLLLPSQIKKKQNPFNAKSDATLSSSNDRNVSKLKPDSPSQPLPMKKNAVESNAQALDTKLSHPEENVSGSKDNHLDFESKATAAEGEAPARHHVRISTTPPDAQPTQVPRRQTTSPTVLKEQFLKPILKKSHPPEVRQQLESITRAREGELTEQQRTNLTRSGSNVSDTLSIITEMSEPYGEAESLPYDSDNSSNGTLHDGEFDDSFSDGEEAVDNLNGSVIDNLDIVGKPEVDVQNRGGDGEDDYSESDSQSLTSNSQKSSQISSSHPEGESSPPLNRDEEDLNGTSAPGLVREDSNPEDISVEKEPSISSQNSDWDSEKELKDSECSAVSRESTESSRHMKQDQQVDEITQGSQDNVLKSTGDSGEDLGRLENGQLVKVAVDTAMQHNSDDESDISSDVDAEKKATLLSLAKQKEEQDLKNSPRPARSRYSHLPEATVDLDNDSHQGTVRGRRSASPRGAYDHYNSESARDSDSGVNSSHTSRTTTPDQRFQQHQQQRQADQLSVPAIAVSNAGDEREEEDDLDELFNNHRPHLLGSRSSLADSRESIYSVYSDAGEVNYGRIPVTGDIMFNLSYNAKNSSLEVHIKQCKDLAPVDTKHNRSDPYVKTYLLPDKTRGSKRKTKIKKHTLNPTFDEVLKYPISKTELESRNLWVTVWHNDRFGRNDFLGEVTIPLDYYRFDDNAPRWYPLQERVAPQETMMHYKGDLFVSLKYVPADMVETSTTKKKSSSFRKKGKEKEKLPGLGEVHVLVREAQNLTAMRASAGSNPFCKGYILPDVSHASKQKTPVIKKTTNPQWQHILVFEGLEQSLLFQHGLELTVWDHEKLSSNDFLGGVRLNLGQGTYQGKLVDWMDARGEEVEAWQSMMDHPNEWIDVQLPLRASMGKQNVKK